MQIFLCKSSRFSRLPANALDSWPTWCCPPRVWCMPPHCPPIRCWPWRSRWPSSPCWAPQASRPGPETVRGTDVCPGSCASRSTRYRSERRGSDWPSPDLRVRDNYKSVLLTKITFNTIQTLIYYKCGLMGHFRLWVWQSETIQQLIKKKFVHNFSLTIFYSYFYYFIVCESTQKCLENYYTFFVCVCVIFSYVLLF